MGEQKQKTNGTRRPIPVEKLTFHALHAVNIPGHRQATSCKRSPGPNKRYEIEFHPWLRSFLVIYQSSPKMPVQRDFIGEHQVMTWKPCEGAATS